MSVNPHHQKSEDMAETVSATVTHEINMSGRIVGHHRGEHTVALAILCLRETLIELYSHHIQKP